MIFLVEEEFLTMAEEKKSGVSVYISPEIVEVLKQRHKKTMKLALRLDWIR
ncbi:hypothetical protein OkiPb00492_42720 [Escherichia coli]|nr:putative prophage protein [Escherichia coli EC4013]